MLILKVVLFISFGYATEILGIPHFHRSPPKYNQNQGPNEKETNIAVSSGINDDKISILLDKVKTIQSGIKDIINAYESIKKKVDDIFIDEIENWDEFITARCFTADTHQWRAAKKYFIDYKTTIMNNVSMVLVELNETANVLHNEGIFKNQITKLKAAVCGDTGNLEFCSSISNETAEIISTLEKGVSAILEKLENQKNVEEIAMNKIQEAKEKIYKRFQEVEDQFRCCLYKNLGLESNCTAYEII